MKKVAFISGPIHGMETQQEYREIISEICNRLGFEVIDPWRREKVLYNREAPCWWDKVPAEGFVQRDLEDADRCDLMIVYLPKLSAGACMELFYARRKGKKVVVVSDLCLSPWIVVHSDAVLKGFGELEAALKQLMPHL
ncbi:MAG: nucleoside 2-deoxyribosyltransferase [Candidatus Bathyarchaeota archaeon]|nr:nucleoside 2-deoxyribosyltransferase [Candidatus Bathyarchaeota archaeon]